MFILYFFRLQYIQLDFIQVFSFFLSISWHNAIKYLFFKPKKLHQSFLIINLKIPFPI